MGNRIMPRSVHQAIYKYLPGAWGDFYDRDSRTSYTMLVKYWNSTNLEGINKKRIIAEVSNEVKQFEARGGRTLGFGSINPSEYNVLTPKCSENPEIPDIISFVSPLTFVCNKCNSVTTFNNSYTYLKNPQNKYCKKSNCGGEIKQISLVYACTCGWAGPIFPNRCRIGDHGIKYLKYRPGKEFRYTCTRDGNKIEMYKVCPECGKRLTPRNTTAGDIFIPFNFTIIELLNNQEESFIIDKEDSPYVVIANWLNKIDDTEYNKIVKNSHMENMNTYEEQYNRLLQQLLDAGLSEEQARNIARDNATENDPNANRKKVIDEIKPLITCNHLIDEYNLRKLAISLVEYKTIINSDVKITIEEGMERAMAQNSIFSPEEYLSILDKYGFKRIEASGNIPMINCVYGYTRREFDPKDLPGERLTLRALQEEKPGVKNIYGIKLNTEGILFELDRGKVIQWLIKNKVLDENSAPDIDDEDQLKQWFLNNINLDGINTFSNIDRGQFTYTYYVYNLIHSICHALIKVSEEFSGLDKNSLGEYLFPTVPGFLIYCQNNQGTSLGSLFSLYTSVLNKWIIKADESMSQCIFDPICIDRDEACLGCLYINEISCRHFNKDLNRRYLIGYTDLYNDVDIHGYWRD